MAEGQFQLRIAGCTDTGVRRQQNEDHIGFHQDLGIAVLADGMGGHQCGEVASHMAVESVLRKLKTIAERQSLRPITSSQLSEIVSNTISQSNTMIFEASEALEDQRGMGTTLVAVLVHGTELCVGHVGDSRLYLLRNQELKRITKDHSLVQDLVDKGFYTEAEARKANVGHIVTRALGTKDSVEVDTLHANLEEGDVLLMCSDGLSDMVEDWHIEEVLSDGCDELESKAQELVDLANQNGGRDNISVILIQVGRAADKD